MSSPSFFLLLMINLPSSNYSFSTSFNLVSWFSARQERRWPMSRQIAFLSLSLELMSWEDMPHAVINCTFSNISIDVSSARRIGTHHYLIRLTIHSLASIRFIRECQSPACQQAARVKINVYGHLLGRFSHSRSLSFILIISRNLQLSWRIDLIKCVCVCVLILTAAQSTIERRILSSIQFDYVCLTSTCWTYSRGSRKERGDHRKVRGDCVWCEK